MSLLFQVVIWNFLRPFGAGSLTAPLFPRACALGYVLTPAGASC